MSRILLFVLACVMTSFANAASHAPAQRPPAGLAPAEAPQFIMLSSDDNPDPEAMQWMLDVLAERRNPDGSPIHMVFYSNGKYLDPSPELSALHRRAFLDGHEMGNHTYHHDHGGAFSHDRWFRDMRRHQQALEAAGIPGAAVAGFRAPFLEYNANTFTAAAAMGFLYETSIEEGYQPGQDGTDFYWPYTLDHGSPGNALSAEWGGKEPVPALPAGFWQVPIHVLLVPDDATCPAYGLAPGLRQRIHDTVKAREGWEWSPEAGKITGFDWNVLESARLSGDAFLALLKYNLDLRLRGNRAPFMFGGHSALYPADMPDRRRAFEAFVDYARGIPAVRFVTPVELIAWMQDPRPL